MNNSRMYDSLAEDYDRFTNWNNRLSFELPFIQQELQQISPSTSARVLDAACGTGMHAIALARQGFNCAGADLSRRMIEEAVQNAENAGVNIDFKVAGFGELQQRFTPRKFDALLCLGNSLPHVLTTQELQQTLVDFARCLRPGGLLLIQNRNFDAILERKERWMPPEPYGDQTGEWLFQRFYDFEPDGLIRFNMVTLKRRLGSDWTAQVTSTMLFPQTESFLRHALADAGFIDLHSMGSMQGDPFNPQTSGNLVITARIQ